MRLQLLMLVALLVSGSVTRAGEPIDFKRDIRPILSDACFQCHGPDAEQRQADLRLDEPDSAFADRGGYAALTPGKPEASEVIARMTASDPDLRMPPADSGKSLAPQQIDLLKRWIAEGAQWSKHWSFVPPERPPVPAVSMKDWVRTPMDAFILRRLEQEGLSPSPPADKVTLLRRLYLDLIGLPPTIEQVDAFLQDQQPDAYARVVEQLLDSPHYGERWGRHWLDAARYADSDGYEKDKPRTVWAYRDWVVNAINRDMPYDQFIIEQIAGDLLPDATQDQLVATGFLRNSMINEEGGVDPEQFRMEAMFDRMDAIGKGVLGLTIQCAQCHTHKFDPLTQEEYYEIFAFLNNSHEANIAVYTPSEQRQRARIFGEIDQIETQLRDQTPDWAARMAAWEESVRGNQPEWVVVQPAVDDISSGGQRCLPMDDGSLLAQGYAPTKHTVKLTVRTEMQNITAFRLELLNDPNLPMGGPGRSVRGTAALTEFLVDAAPVSEPGKSQRVKIARASADINLPEQPLDPIYDDRSDKKRTTGPIDFAIDGNELTAWGIDIGPGRRNQPRKAVFNAETPIAHEGGTVLTFHLSQRHGGWNSDDNQNCNLGKFRVSITNAADVSADPLPKTVREILAIPSDKRTPVQRAAVFSYWRTTVPEWKEANDRIEELWRQHPEGTTQLVLDERERMRPTHLLARGDFLKPMEKVKADVPAFLHSLPSDAPRDRLTFARWLVDRDSPTTARAFVNRVWQTYFGIGIVSTSEDLGSQAEAPSHPELLDWLAVEFMEGGWSLKKLHRLIVNSATYQQSSRVTAQLLQCDPYNRLLARGPRFRVEAEVVRDIFLAASGLLNSQIGGPSVYPPAPEFLFVPPASYGPKVWKEDKDADRYRRAFYTFRFRSVPYPMLQTFDAPNGDASCVRRTRSNTPLQALTTLNEPLFVECAQALAERTLHDGGASDADRLTYAFRRCVARPPSDIEQSTLLSLFEQQKKRFEEGGLDPWLFAARDPKTPPALPEGATPADAAAWTAVCRVILNLDETITKE